MTSNTSVQRLIEKFEKGAASDWERPSYSTRHGIAAVLRQIAHTLEDLADDLEGPTLLERAMKGDANAAKQFLHEAGFTDKQGQWLPQYQPIADNTND